MPVVRPYPLGEVQPQGLPNAIPNVPAASDVASFGGNQARDLQVAGANLDKTSDIVATMALRQQALQDEADAKAADAGLANDIRALLFDPEKGYYAKRGKEAIDAAPGVLQALGDLKQKYNGSLKTGTSRRLYGDVADRRIGGLQTQIGEKVIAERRTYADQASAARVQNFVDDAGVNYTDQKQVEQAIAGAKSEILSHSEINHEPPAETQRKLRLVESKAISDVIKRWAEEDPYKAKAIRDANVGRIDSADGMALDKILKEQLLRRASQDSADEIRQGSRLPAAVEMRRPLIQAAAGAAGVTPALVAGVMAQESRGRDDAVSSARARGPMQLMPGTAKDLGVTDAHDADQAVPAGARYLKQQLDKYGDEKLALMAYNWGPGNVDNWIKAGSDPAKVPTETRDYVRKVQGYAARFDGSQAIPDMDPKTGRPTLQWQLDQTTKISDPDMRDATVQRLRVLHGQDEAVVVEARKEVGDQVLSLVMDGKLTDRGQIPADKWVALDPIQQRAMQSLLEANARGADIPPNPGLYAELMRQARRDPEAFKKRDLVPLASQLPPAHWTKFQDLQASMWQPENAASEKLDSMVRAMRMSDALLRSASIHLGHADSKSFDDFKARYMSVLDQEIDRYRAKNGKPPDDGELTKMADRLLLQGNFRGTGFFSEDRAVSFLQGKGDGAPQFYVRYRDIPLDKRTILETELKAAGRPYNKRAVENLYTALRLAGKQ